jgi:hypothetical protein
MMNKQLISLLLLLFTVTAFAQELPYRQIPEYPASYNEGTVAARVVDGLGFRYYWATEGLRPEDLKYKPSDEARTTDETLDHILGLTTVLFNAVTHKINDSPAVTGLSFEEKRKRTLANIQGASEILKKSSAKELEGFKIIFKGNNGNTEFPFWNLLNGPIDDALWHVGQVITFRRSSGNPFNSNVSVLQGKVRE